MSSLLPGLQRKVAQEQLLTPSLARYLRSCGAAILPWRAVPPLSQEMALLHQASAAPASAPPLLLQ